MSKLLILLLISGFAFSQNITKKESINKFLLKTWVADYAMMNGLKVEKMGAMKAMEYNFKADGTFLANKTVNGTWKYNEKKKGIELFVNGSLKSTIISLQSKRIAMVLNADKQAPKNVKSFEIFFKPKA